MLYRSTSILLERPTTLGVEEKPENPLDMGHATRYLLRNLQQKQAQSVMPENRIDSDEFQLFSCNMRAGMKKTQAGFQALSRSRQLGRLSPGVYGRIFSRVLKNEVL